MIPILQLNGIRAGYGAIEVLHGIDLTLHQGEVYALLGPNGAGKTTTLSVCSGQLPPTGGTVKLLGREVNGVRADVLARAGVCLIPEGRGIFPNLTVRENLRMSTYSGTSLAQVEERAFDQFPRLAERAGQIAGTLSGGEQQMLAMSRALATDPALLLLDELSMGLAPLIVTELYERVGELAASGLSILIVEQFVQTVLGVADTAAVMVGGQIHQVGDPAAIAEGLSAAYLGGEMK